MVNIFAREITDELTSLVKAIDKQVAENEDKKMAAFVVFLTDDPDALEPKLKELAQEHKIENVPLTLMEGQTGPPSYKIAQDADVTVMMWRDREVKANHAFAKGQLKSKDVEAISAETSKILE